MSSLFVVLQDRSILSSIGLRCIAYSSIRYPPSVVIASPTFHVRYMRVGPPRAVDARIAAIKHFSKEIGLTPH